jgi:hypothetical protein
MAEPYDTTVIRGDTLRWTFNWSSLLGQTFDMSGSTLYMAVGRSFDNTSLLVNYEVNVVAGSTAVSPQGFTGGISSGATGGTLFVCVGSTYTQRFPLYTSVFYDIQLTKASNKDVLTLQNGQITILPDVNVT